MEHLISAAVGRVRDHTKLLIPKHCNGCIVNHLSQSQHTVCLLMSWDEQVEWFFGDTYESVDSESLYSATEADCGHILSSSECLRALWQDIFWWGLIPKRIVECWTTLEIHCHFCSSVYLYFFSHVFGRKRKFRTVFDLDHTELRHL